MKQVIKLKRRGLAFILVIVFLASFAPPVYADKLTKRLDDQKRQRAAMKANYSDILDKIDAIEAQIEKLDNNIEDKLGQIVATNKRISYAKAKIATTQKAIDNTSKSINAEQELYYKRLKAMYMNGPIGYLDLLLSSSSFIDFLERYELTKSIMKYDTHLIKNLENRKKTKQRQKALLVQQKNALLKLQSNLKASLAQLNAAKAKQKSLISYMKKEAKKYKNQIAEYNKMIRVTLNQIAEMKKKLKNPNSTVYSSDRLVVYAAKFLGVRYVWGGTTPSGFDCSGFTKYVYAHFGIKLNRVSRDQARQGTRISKANLRPGDLVFFGSPIHHVGIYVGNNSFIHAPRTGDVVHISQLTRKDFAWGVRLR
jgi:peptidoglycan DL-endopeptidase CwlO